MGDRASAGSRTAAVVGGGAIALLAILGATGCSPGGHQTPTPRAVCEQHFANVLDATADTVAGVTEVGPRPLNAQPVHLGTYAGDTPVTLCLVARSGDLSDAIVITPDGLTYVVWRQNGDRLTRPL